MGSIRGEHAMSSRLATVLFVAFLCVPLCSCSNPKKALIGSWKVDGGSLAGTGAGIQFRDNRAFTVTMGGQAFPGTYEWVDKDTIRETFSMGGQQVTQEYDVAIKGDHLTLTGPTGTPETLTRAK